MTTIATLLVRDEAEIVRECIEHHLAHGIDGFIVTDNGSQDNTRDLVRACPGILEVIDEPKHDHHQSLWVTRMARRAHKLHARWLVHIDADEFWYGLEALKTKEFAGIGSLTVRHEYLHVPVEGLVFGEFSRTQMPYYYRVKHPMPKVIHRAAVGAAVTHGNHIVYGVPGRVSAAPRDICIHHYPVRSYGHFEAKTIKGGEALLKHPGPVTNGKRWRNWYKEYQLGHLPEVYREKLCTAAKIEELLAAGVLSCQSQK